MARPAWTFTGCGLLGGYYLGVWHALSRPTVPRALFDAQTSRFHGASAGALISAAIASGCRRADTTNAFERIAEAVGLKARRHRATVRRLAHVHHRADGRGSVPETKSVRELGLLRLGERASALRGTARGTGASSESRGAGASARWDEFARARTLWGSRSMTRSRIISNLSGSAATASLAVATAAERRRSRLRSAILRPARP